MRTPDRKAIYDQIAKDREAARRSAEIARDFAAVDYAIGRLIARYSPQLSQEMRATFEQAKAEAAEVRRQENDQVTALEAEIANLEKRLQAIREIAYQQMQPPARPTPGPGDIAGLARQLRALQKIA